MASADTIRTIPMCSPTPRSTILTSLTALLTIGPPDQLASACAVTNHAPSAVTDSMTLLKLTSVEP